MEPKKKSTAKLNPPKPGHAHFFIRDIPHDLHHKVKSLAALRGITLREFVVEALRDKAEAQP
jgi:predicted HicB family RNase H-like nuclease